MNPKKVYYKDTLVAYLSNSCIEWPRSDSIYEQSNNLSLELQDFIQASINYAILIDKNDEEALQIHVDRVESKYLDIINSEEWYILDDEEVKHPILAPIFHPENIMVWMFQ